MSRAATDWAWSLAIKPATTKLILLSMADRADEEHCCFPSIKRLERDTSLNRKTIMDGIERLLAAGILSDTGERKGKTQRVRVFRLNLESSQKRNDTENGTITTPNGTENGTLNGTENGTLNGTENGTQNQSVEPVNEPGSAGAENQPAPEKQKAARKRAMPDDFKPNETCRSKAIQLGINMEVELDKFTSFHQAKGNKYVDWQAAFRNWLTKAAEFRGQRGGNVSQPPLRQHADDSGSKIYVPTPAKGGAR